MWGHLQGSLVAVWLALPHSHALGHQLDQGLEGFTPLQWGKYDCKGCNVTP
jgi:hypothetical protein